MDKNKDADKPRESLKKTPFHFKNDNNGLIFTVHHTVEEEIQPKTKAKGDVPSSALVRVRLINACFSFYNTHFVAIDHRGNIFVFDLILKNLWQLDVKVERSSVVRNSIYHLSDFLIGTKGGEVHQVDIETGIITNAKRFCNFQIGNISFPPSDLTENRKDIFLVHSIDQAILVDNTTFEITHKLEFNDSKFSLKFCTYFPKTDKILTCFTNDAVHIWTGVVVSNSSNHDNFGRSSLNTIRVLYPIKIRDKQVKLRPAPELNISRGLDGELDSGMSGSVFEVKDYTNGLINSYSFSIDGLYMCLTTVDNYILILSTVTFDLVRIIQMNNIHCVQCCCISPGNSSNEMLLFGLTASVSDIVLIDCNDLLVKAVLQNGNAYKMENSNDGKMLFVVLKTGEINVFQNSAIINALKSTQRSLDSMKVSIKKTVKSKGSVELPPELRNTLTRSRLMPILEEFGGFTEKYRHVIWNNLLELPNNKIHFVELMKKGFHPAVSNYGQKFPLRDITMLRNLKKLVSCLCFWSPVFGHCEFIPKFVFPFLRIYPNSLLASFELIITILLNHCQLWFEFAPMQPLNYLGIIENILKHFDAELLDFYAKKQIDSKIYAWSLLSTGFSEVFDCEQWFHFWDNVLSNTLDYLVFAVVGYQIIQRNVIMRLQTFESMELFFHDQNIIDMKRFHRKINELKTTCPQAIHPTRYLKEFDKIPKGFYPKFENYPKDWIQKKDREIESIRLENALLDMKMRDLEENEFKMAQKLEQGLKDEEHAKRLNELNKVYCSALAHEEERIACQRKMLMVYKKDLRNQNITVEDLVRESENRKTYNQQENKLDMLMMNIERARTRDEAQILSAEEDSKDRRMHSLASKYKMKKKIEPNSSGTGIANKRSTTTQARSRPVSFKFSHKKPTSSDTVKIDRHLEYESANSKEKIDNLENRGNGLRSISSIQKSLDKIQNRFDSAIKSQSDKRYNNKGVTNQHKDT